MRTVLPSGGPAEDIIATPRRERELAEIGYKPPAGAVVTRGVHGLTGNENLQLFRERKPTPTNPGSKSRMPLGFKPRIAVPAPKVPILSAGQIAKHEDLVQKIISILSPDENLRPLFNLQGNEYLPSQEFTPAYEENTKHIANMSPEDRLVNDVGIQFPVAISNEDIPFIEGGIRAAVPTEVRDTAAIPSGFSGGSSVEGNTPEIVRGTTADISPYLMKPLVVRFELPPIKNRLNEARLEREFLDTLNSNELALNAAKQEPGFRIEDFARERGWGVTYARRLQTAFNKKVAAWKEAGVNPDMIAASVEESLT